MKTSRGFVHLISVVLRYTKQIGSKVVKIRISVVSVVKNLVRDGRRAQFDEMMASVRNQDYGRVNIEHIIIDGASDDGTVDILRRLQRDGSIDTLISEPDTGIYSAMNKGIKVVRGDCVLFLNSDDYLDSSGLRKLTDKLEDDRADYVYANAVKVDRKGRTVGRHDGDIREIYFGAPYCHQALMCRKNCFRHATFDEDFKVTMWTFALKLYQAGLTHSHLNEDVAYFRVGGASTGRHEELLKQEQFRIRSNYIAPMVDLQMSEYDYLRKVIRSTSNSQKARVDVDNIALKLLGADTGIKADFNRKLLSLLINPPPKRPRVQI